MRLWGYEIDSAFEWAVLILIILCAFVLYFAFVWFVQKYTTGIVGGFILMFAGLALILIPAWHILSGDIPKYQIYFSGAAIIAGCVSAIVGAFSLRDNEDF